MAHTRYASLLQRISATPHRLLLHTHSNALAHLVHEKSSSQPAKHVILTLLQMSSQRVYACAAATGDHGTSHLSVVDAKRNAVSFTTTINTSFGSKLLSPSTGGWRQASHALRSTREVLRNMAFQRSTHLPCLM